MTSKMVRGMVSIILILTLFLPGAAVPAVQAATPGTIQWLQNHTSYITYPYAEDNDQTGGAVSQSSDGVTYVLGARNETVDGKTGQGAAYLLDNTGVTVLYAGDGVASDHFGIAVAVSGDGNTVLVGAYQATLNGYAKHGAAYVFARNPDGYTWAQQQKLTVDSSVANLFFGTSVALSADGNTALIGANGYTDTGAQQGAAYVFVRSGTNWSRQTASPLIASDPAAGDWFGNAVALSADGNLAVVAACGKSSNRGAAYTYTRSHGAWTFQNKFTAWDAAPGDDFAHSVALSDGGNVLLVGADNATVNGMAVRGAAYTFTHSFLGWFNGVKLVAEDGQADDYFGYSVDLSGDGSTAVVGATNQTVNTRTAQGAGYVFYGARFGQQQKLVASDGAMSDAAGAAVSINGDGATIWLGAPSAPLKGKGYRFDRYTSDWWQANTLYGSINDAMLGHALAISADGSTLVVGSGDNWKSMLDTVYIYGHQYNRWYLQAAIPTPDPGGEYQHGFGLSVAVSADGNTVLIGNYKVTVGANTNQGMAYLVTRTGTTWSAPVKLTEPGGAPKDYFGLAVALSGDGNTAVIGAEGYASGSGAAYVMTRSGATWSGLARLQVAELGGNFGASVALNDDGSTLLVGADSASDGASDVGAAYAFTRSGGTYTQQQKLTRGSGIMGPIQFGFSVALSSDGNTAAIGQPCNGCGTMYGETYIFVRSNTSWSKQIELNAVDYPHSTLTADQFGRAVDLSSDGNTLVIGANHSLVYGESERGAAYVYTRSGTAWAPQAKLVADKSYPRSWNASAVAISGDGRTVLFNAYTDPYSYRGGVYFFTTNKPSYSAFVPVTKK